MAEASWCRGGGAGARGTHHVVVQMQAILVSSLIASSSPGDGSGDHGAGIDVFMGQQQIDAARKQTRGAAELLPLIR